MNIITGEGNTFVWDSIKNTTGFQNYNIFKKTGTITLLANGKDILDIIMGVWPSSMHPNYLNAFMALEPNTATVEKMIDHITTLKNLKGCKDAFFDQTVFRLMVPYIDNTRIARWKDKNAKFKQVWVSSEVKVAHLSAQIANNTADLSLYLDNNDNIISMFRQIYCSFDILNEPTFTPLYTTMVFSPEVMKQISIDILTYYHSRPSNYSVAYMFMLETNVKEITEHMNTMTDMTPWLMKYISMPHGYKLMDEITIPDGIDGVLLFSNYVKGLTCRTDYSDEEIEVIISHIESMTESYPEINQIQSMVNWLGPVQNIDIFLAMVDKFDQKYKLTSILSNKAISNEFIMDVLKEDYYANVRYDSINQILMEIVENERIELFQYTIQRFGNSIEGLSSLKTMLFSKMKFNEVKALMAINNGQFSFNLKTTTASEKRILCSPESIQHMEDIIKMNPGWEDKNYRALMTKYVSNNCSAGCQMLNKLKGIKPTDTERNKMKDNLAKLSAEVREIENMLIL